MFQLPIFEHFLIVRNIKTQVNFKPKVISKFFYSIGSQIDYTMEELDKLDFIVGGMERFADEGEFVVEADFWWTKLKHFLQVRKASVVVQQNLMRLHLQLTVVKMIQH